MKVPGEIGSFRRRRGTAKNFQAKAPDPDDTPESPAGDTEEAIPYGRICQVNIRSALIISALRFLLYKPPSGGSGELPPAERSGLMRQ